MRDLLESRMKQAKARTRRTSEAGGEAPGPSAEAVVRVLKKYPKIEKVLNEVSASLNVETMRELNGQVDLDQEDPEDVAKQHLEDEGIID